MMSTFSKPHALLQSLRYVFLITGSQQEKPGYPLYGADAFMQCPPLKYPAAAYIYGGAKKNYPAISATDYKNCNCFCTLPLIAATQFIQQSEKP